MPNGDRCPAPIGVSGVIVRGTRGSRRETFGGERGVQPGHDVVGHRPGVVGSSRAARGPSRARRGRPSSGRSRAGDAPQPGRSGGSSRPSCRSARVSRSRWPPSTTGVGPSVTAGHLPLVGRWVGRSWSAGLGGGTPTPASRFPSAARSSGSSRARPRAHRLFTVPVGQSSTCGGVLDRPAVHVHQHQSGPLLGRHAWPELPSRPARSRAPRPGPGLAPAGPARAAGRPAGRRGPAHPVQAGVDDDAVQPRGHRRLAAEGAASHRSGRRRGRPRPGRPARRRRPPRGRRGCAEPPPTAGPGAAGRARRRHPGRRRRARRAAPRRVRVASPPERAPRLLSPVLPSLDGSGRRLATRWAVERPPP